MNTKGEMNSIGGAILVVFVGIIVGLAIYNASLGFIGTATNSVTLTNQTVTLGATANSSSELSGYQELIGTLFIQNNSDGVYLGDGTQVAGFNVTAAECIGSDGLKGVCFYPSTAVYASRTVNVTGTFGPDGYIDSSGGRSIAGLIAIFAALAIAIVALQPTLRGGVMEMLGR